MFACRHPRVARSRRAIAKTLEQSPHIAGLTRVRASSESTRLKLMWHDRTGPLARDGRPPWPVGDTRSAARAIATGSLRALVATWKGLRRPGVRILRFLWRCGHVERWQRALGLCCGAAALGSVRQRRSSLG